MNRKPASAVCKASSPAPPVIRKGGAITRVQAALLLLTVGILVVYSNTFRAAWHLDDYPNIVFNERIHLSQLNWDQIRQCLRAKPGGSDELYRPVAMLSFALNGYVGQGAVFGYHIVNTGVHVVSAGLLFLTILCLLRSPNSAARLAEKTTFWIALFGAGLWALHPIQTQAVTYIVQRMASLAGMFYILALYCFVRARQEASCRKRVLFYLATVLSGLLAVGSKENAFLLPVTVFLVELVFFQDLTDAVARKHLFWISVVGGMILFCLAVVLFLNGSPFGFLHGYRNRPFTLEERLLSCPRILFGYLFQIVYPIPLQFSLIHDFKPSISLFSPWWTVLAWVAMLSLIGFAIRKVPQTPFFSFGILFYFINHLVESTVIPLELVFEHRNYIPSMFVFFPLAAACWRLIQHCRGRSRFLYNTVVAAVGILCVLVGFSTYNRNKAWQTSQTMLADIIRKAPDNVRTKRALAQSLMDQGRWGQALVVYQRLLNRKGYHTTYHRASTLNNMGNLYQELGQWGKALACYRQVLHLYPDHQTAFYNMTLTHLRMGALQAAAATADQLLSRASDHEDYLNIKALILIRQKQYRKAVPYLQKALRIAPGSRNVSANLAFALSRLGNASSAELFYSRLVQQAPGDLVVRLGRIENFLLSGKLDSARKSVQELFRRSSLTNIIQQLETAAANRMSIPLDKNRIADFLARQLRPFYK